MTPMLRRALLGIATITAVASTLAAPAPAQQTNPIVDRISAILDPPGGTNGLYLKQVGGPIVAAKNEAFPFEPASSVKVIPHLYAHVQVQVGAAAFTDQVPLYSDSYCPGEEVVLGTEDLSASLGKMMRVSDNPAARAQFDHWTLPNLNAFVSAVGTTQTELRNPIGCQAPGVATIDDNTTSLADLGRLYEGVADGSLLDGPIRASFYDLMSGRQQFEEFGYDFTGIWPKLLVMVDEEAPTALSEDGIAAFKNAMTANHKGGNYGRCLDFECTQLLEWLSVAGWAQFPTCDGTALGSEAFVWGLFIHGSVDPDFAGSPSPAALAITEAAAEPLREQLSAALARWSECASAPLFGFEPVLPVPGQSVRAGSRMPIRFAIIGDDGGPISDNAARALAATCSIRASFTAGRIGSGCVHYSQRTDTFWSSVRIDRHAEGTHTVIVRIFDGPTLVLEEQVAVEVIRPGTRRTG